MMAAFRGIGMRKAALTLLLFLLACAPAAAGPWSMTVYGGPTTYTIFTDTLNGKSQFNSAMVGLAVDRHVAYLGWGWHLMAEGQLQQFAAFRSKDFIEGTGNYAAVSLGLGIEYHSFPWKRELPTSLSFYIGPSYSFGPPLQYPREQWGSRKALLNYLGIELAVTLPQQHNLDAVFRLFHRSGVWGIYTNDVQEATTLGVGLRYRF
jgi:hypothetical protein